MANVESKKADNIWSRRLAKRLAGARTMKVSPEYEACNVRLGTPGPSDRAVSKRGCQRSTQALRRSIHDQAQQSPIDWLEGHSKEEIPIKNFLTGNWQDQRGSIYQLFPGSGGFLHVETTRPCGQMRYTRDLLKVTMVRGHEKTIWGCCRYELERRGPDELLWRGKSAKDVFSWRRM